MTLTAFARGRPLKLAGIRCKHAKPGLNLLRALALLLAGLLAICAPSQAQTQIARTRHNLTPGGPGNIRSSEPTGVCVFCHISHNANPTRGLWNRELPGVSYQLYTSSTLKAQLNQPTGSSRLCLSCHDGILSLGNLRVSPNGAPLTLGRLTGSSALGTDLSKDHPVSFVYDRALALSRGELADPLTLPPAIRLDQTGQLQCTSCHDAHEDKKPNFLRLDTGASGLCSACHRPHNWSSSAHATSQATWSGSGISPWMPGAPATVAENGCLNCHRSHAAGHSERLLAQVAEPANCTVCHSGSVASKNIEAEFLKPLRHPIEIDQWVHAPKENPLAMPRHIACTDCHNAHAANAAPAAPPGVSGRLAGVPGVTISGTPVAEASFEHEVCSKCHGLREPTTPGIARQSGTRNIRVKINPVNISYHPVAAIGTNAATLGLEPGYSSSSIISCTSCHTNDDWTPNGTNPAGPHGSRYEPILGWPYATVYPTPESPQSYALCYQCHNRGFLITDQAGTFHHASHVSTQQAPCAACHDAHGSPKNAHLIDFMLRDRTGNALVTPSSVQRRLEYISLGPGRGQCYLQCHGSNHEPKSYP